jgi:EAL domain-containing protein (putative c-di-GMP-specific phosphodiesterase class I)/CheY-like chemotaxis protein
MAGASPTLSGSPRVRVIVADDDPDMQLVLADLISDADTLELVGVAEHADAAIELAACQHPDVALVDVRMPGGGVAATVGIRQTSPQTKVIAFSADEDRRTVIGLLEAGALGYLVKDASGHMIVQAIERAAGGQGSLAGAVTAGVIDELVQQRAEKRQAQQHRHGIIARIQRAMEEPDALSIYLQPICSLSDGVVVGVEALSRFGPEPHVPPDHWFADADQVGRRVTLELLAIDRALALMPSLPASIYLAVNASPTTLASERLGTLLQRSDPIRVVVELTENAAIDDYESFGSSLARVRTRGARIAVDDAGAGYASLRHILKLAPDLIKLDRTLIAGIEHDRPTQALAAGLISFANQCGASIVAEGIESQGQLTALRALGVSYGQGYFLSPPQPAATLDATTYTEIERRLQQAPTAHP